MSITPKNKRILLYTASAAALVLAWMGYNKLSSYMKHQKELAAADKSTPNP